MENDTKRFAEAVRAMRVAQKMEWDALPSNFRLWKRSRAQQSVALLERQVDDLLKELLRSFEQEGNVNEKERELKV